MWETVDLLRIEIDMMEEKDLVDSPIEIMEGERVVGELTMPQRKMFSMLSCQFKLENPCIKNGISAIQCHLRKDIINSILYDSIRRTLNMYDINIGIRTGFKVVAPIDGHQIIVLRCK
jgi:hypothetical protein